MPGGPHRCRVVHIGRTELPETAFAFSIWSATLATAQALPFRHIISDGRRDGPYASCWRLLLEALLCLGGGGQTARHTLPAVGLALVEVIDTWLDRVFASRRVMAEKGTALRARLDALLGAGSAVLVCPSLLTPAPRHHENLLRFPDAGQCAIFNVLALPATAVPLGADPRTKLPLGCQVVGGFGCDRVSIAVAEELERLGVAKAVTVTP